MPACVMWQRFKISQRGSCEKFTQGQIKFRITEIWEKNVDCDIDNNLQKKFQFMLIIVENITRQTFKY